MEKKKGGWKTTCERFVAYLDIMGFKDRVYRESHEDVRKMLESLRSAIDVIEYMANLELGRIKPIK